MTNINLSVIATGTGGFVINGEATDDRSGWSVSDAGDINGDGLDDVIVGAWGKDADFGSGNAGRSYVVFGKSDNTAINLSAVATGSGGFAITGESSSDYCGFSVSATGDVNGDGLADLIVGAFSNATAGIQAGRSYVVFGKSDGSEVNLSAVANGTGGFAITGEAAEDLSGNSVSAAGDVNGDGLADLIVAAYRNDTGGSNAGRSYVVFGKKDGTEVNLSTVANGSAGFAITGEAAGSYCGQSVSAAGDVNGDGLADLIVGAKYSDANGSHSGRSYVVFGKSDGSQINLAELTSGNGGFAITGEAAEDLSGNSVSAAGDVNGDGLADLIVGANGVNNKTGRSYVVFGKSDSESVNLTDITAGTGGFAITGEATADNSGFSVSTVGDVNGDGLADLIVGAYGNNAGRSYVVFGKSDGSAVDLSAIANGSGGFAINGEIARDYSGRSVSAAGDVNGDGLADLIIGADRSDAKGSDSGRSYVIFGSTTGAFADTAVDHVVTHAADILTDEADADHTLIGSAGNDTIAGNGGADVIYAGAGDDSILLNADNIAQLAANFTAGNYARVDGGGGIDTLKIDGSGIALDLTIIANQGGAAPSSSSRLETIEKIDLSGSGDNSLKLSVRDVIDMAGFNLFNAGNGWSGLDARVARHQLIVDGNHGDSVTFLAGEAGDWSLAGFAFANGNSYSIFDHPDAAQLLVNNAILYNPVYASNRLAATKDKLSGTAEQDLVDGGLGADSMKGGAGDDSYIVDNKGDKVTEAANQGTDTVLSSIGYKLGKNLENLILTGSDNLNATGNELANVLTGNSGDNLLDGGKGIDHYRGGAGNDTYLIDNLLETDIVELDDQGTDTIQLKVDKLAAGQSSADYTLPDNVENLILTGKAQINLFGNDGDNRLTGNAKANQLTGGDGADTFVFTAPSKTNIDTILDFETGTDKIALDGKLFKKLLGDSDLSDNFENITAVDNDNYLLYDKDTGKLYYDADGSGKKTMVLIGIFDDSFGNHPQLSAGDFLVV